MVAKARIDTPEEVLELIELSVKSMKRELACYPTLKDSIDLGAISRDLKIIVAHQAIKGGFNMRHIFNLISRNINIQESNPNAYSEKTLELLKFKNQYMKWAKNLIAELNRIKGLNKWGWLDVRPVAKTLADLNMEVRDNESFYILDTIDRPELNEWN